MSWKLTHVLIVSRKIMKEDSTKEERRNNNMEANTAINLDAQIESKAMALPDRARTIVVCDNASMEIANNFKLDIKAMIKEVDEWFKPLADKAFQSHRAITGKWNDTKKPLQDADAYVTQQVKNYLAEVKRQQEAEEARLREEARKAEEERVLREAAELEAEGRQDEADEILSEPITYVAPVVRMETPKVDNRMYRTQLKVKVQDRMKFLRSVKPETLLDLLNEASWTTIESGLSKKAKALGKSFHYDGCTVTEC
jgi:hypothetical protein